MRTKNYKKLKGEEKRAFDELVKDNPSAILVRSKQENKGFNDLPLFQQKQVTLF